MFISLTAVSAQEATVLSDEQVKERLSFIQNTLVAAQPAAKTWRCGWITAYAAGTAVQWGLAAAHWDDVKPATDSANAPKIRDRAFAQDMLVGGVTTALGAAGMLWLDPFIPAFGPKEFRTMPESTPEELRAKLRQAEEVLRRCAQREIDGRGWRTHLLNIGVNAAAGIVTAVAFDRPWTDGLITFACGEAVSLLNIFSQPRRAVRDWHDYQVNSMGKSGAYIAGKPKPQWFFGVFPGGFSMRVRF